MRKILLFLSLLISTVSYSQIVDVPDPNFKAALVSHNPVIDTNGDGEIQVAEAQALVGDLRVDDEMISDLTGIEEFVNVTKLFCQENMLSSLDLTPLSALELLNFGNNQMTNLIIDQNNALTEIYGRYNFLTELELPSGGNLVRLRLFENNLNSIDVSGHPNLEFLELSRSNLVEIDISANTQLETFSVTWNNISSLDVSNNLLLETLNFAGNNISSIDVSMLSVLDNIYGSYCNLSSIDLSQNTAMDFVRLTNNNLTGIDFSGLSVLREVDISNNIISNLSFLDNNELTTLTATDNGLESIEFLSSNMVGFLDLSNNNLTNLDTQALPLLYRLNIENNLIETIDLSNNENMVILNLAGNNLNGLDLSGLVNLEGLVCGSNPFTGLDTSPCPVLIQIYLEDSNLVQVDFSANPFLSGIFARNNPDLQSINLRNGNIGLMTIGTTVVFNGGSGIFWDAGVDLEGNSNLAVVCVDDIDIAIDKFVNVPANVSFVEDCSFVGEFNRIEGEVSFDVQNNSCGSGSEDMQNIMVETTDGVDSQMTLTSGNAFYRNFVGQGNFTTSIVGLPSYFLASPMSVDSEFTEYFEIDLVDFCIQAVGEVNDLSVSLVPLEDARPGFSTNYKLVYENIGNTVLDGEVRLVFDDGAMTFESADPTPNSETSNELSWSFSNLSPFENESIDVIFQIFTPPTVEAGDVLQFSCAIEPIADDETPNDNEFTLNQVVVNSFDPNDKRVLQGGQVLIENADEYLHYVIRFQNLGTASAINVRIEDELDSQLDITSLRVLGASHSLETVIDDNLVSFIFNEIYLPAEIDDPAGSNGYVAFKIKPLPGIELGDTISNAADIYFDFNAAIVTNTVSTTYVDILGVSEQEIAEVILFPNPANDTFTIQAKETITSISIYAISGQLVKEVQLGVNRSQIDISELAMGNYFVKVISEQVAETFQLVKN